MSKIRIKCTSISTNNKKYMKLVLNDDQEFDIWASLSYNIISWNDIMKNFSTSLDNNDVKHFRIQNNFYVREVYMYYLIMEFSTEYDFI